MVIRCAGKEKNRDIMVKSFKLLEANPIIEPGEQIFLTALSSCSFSGDYISAYAIYELYEKYHIVVQTKTHALLLIGYHYRYYYFYYCIYYYYIYYIYYFIYYYIYYYIY